MDDRFKIIESLNDLSVELIRHFGKMFAIVDGDTMEIGELVELLAELMVNKSEKSVETNAKQKRVNDTAKILKEIILEHYEMLKISENKFEEKLRKAKKEFKKEQSNIYKKYDIKLQEFISNPAFYIFSIISW